jgi:large subunit ribosomal protein L25
MIEIECLPTQIPQHLEADVSALGIGDSVHVRDLTVPNAVILTDPDVTIATVVPPTVMTETPAGTAAGTATEPEVIAKGKTDDAEGKDKDKDKK